MYISLTNEEWTVCCLIWIQCWSMIDWLNNTQTIETVETVAGDWGDQTSSGAAKCRAGARWAMPAAGWAQHTNLYTSYLTLDLDITRYGHILQIDQDSGVWCGGEMAARQYVLCTLSIYSAAAGSVYCYTGTRQLECSSACPNSHL